LENAAGERKSAGARGFVKMVGEFEGNFFQIVLGAAGKVRAKRFGENQIARREAKFAVERGRENAEAIGAGGEVAAIQDRKSIRTPIEEFAEGGKKFGFAVFAEPL